MPELSESYYLKNSHSGEKGNLTYVWQHSRRRWYIFFFSLALALGGAYLYLRFSPKVYQLRTTLLINPPPKGLTINGSPIALESTETPFQPEDEANLLSSFQLIRETVEALHFQVSYHSTNFLFKQEEYGDLPFQIVLDSTERQAVDVPVYIKLIDKKLYRLKVQGRNVPVFDLTTNQQVDVIPEISIDRILRVDKPFRERYLNFTVKFNKPPDAFDTDGWFFIIHSLNDQASYYQKKLRVHPVSEQSHMLALTIAGTLPAKEADFLNKLVELHLSQALAKQNLSNQEIINFVDRQLGIAKDSFGGTAATPNEPSQIHSSNQLRANLLAEREQIRNSIQVYEYLLQGLKNSEKLHLQASSPTEPELRNQVSQYNKLLQEAERLQAANQPPNQSSILNAQLQKIKIQLVEQLSSLANKGRSNLVVLERSITKSSLPQDATSPSLPVLRQKLNMEESLYKNIYNYLLTRRAEAGIAIATNRINIMVVDEANPANKDLISPNALIVYSIASVLGVLLPLLVMSTRRILRGRILQQADIELNTAIPTLGIVGYNEKASNYLVAYSSKSSLAESFRSLRVNLQSFFLDTGKKVIGITSSQQNEGKTFCAANLSVVMAQSGKKTLLIDTDLRKPRIAARFDLDNIIGLATYLTGLHNLDDIIQTTETENLHIITSGPVPSSPLNLIGNIRMDTLMKKVREEYDYVILDTPPLGLVADFLVLMNYTDFNIFIIRHKLTERSGLNKINELYNAGRLKNVGILINGVKSMSAYGYSDKAYKYGYED